MNKIVSWIDAEAGDCIAARPSTVLVRRRLKLTKAHAIADAIKDSHVWVDGDKWAVVRDKREC